MTITCDLIFVYIYSHTPLVISLLHAIQEPTTEHSNGTPGFGVSRRNGGVTTQPRNEGTQESMTQLGTPTFTFAATGLTPSSSTQDSQLSSGNEVSPRLPIPPLQVESPNTHMDDVNHNGVIPPQLGGESPTHASHDIPITGMTYGPTIIFFHFVRSLSR